MTTDRIRVAALGGLMLFAVAAGLLSNPGFIYAADRTVVGELFSQDG